jgi:hypothetical protein
MQVSFHSIDLLVRKTVSSVFSPASASINISKRRFLYEGAHETFHSLIDSPLSVALMHLLPKESTKRKLAFMISQDCF